MIDVSTFPPDQRLKAWHALENTRAFLMKDRWHKGGWFNVTERKSDGFLFNHTECLSNFIRRVEFGRIDQGVNIDLDGERRPTQEENEQVQMAENFSERGHYDEAGGMMMPLSEFVVCCAIAELFPPDHTKVTTHDQAVEMGLNRHEWLDTDGGVGYRVPFGFSFPRADSDDDVTGWAIDDSIIPDFNDHGLTDYDDVVAVLNLAADLLAPPVTKATDAMTLDEREDIERQTLQAEHDIYVEEVQEWMQESKDRGWISGFKARAIANKRIRDSECIRDNDLRWLKADYMKARKEDRDCVGC